MTGHLTAVMVSYVSNDNVTLTSEKSSLLSANSYNNISTIVIVR